MRDCLQSLEVARADLVFELERCVVVDNASTDDSLTTFKGGALPLQVIKNPENKGFAFACNQGAKGGESEYILFLNPDVRLFPGSLSQAVLFLQRPENGRIGILGIQLLDENGKIQRNAARFPSPRLILYQMLGLDRVWPARFPSIVMKEWDHRTSKVVDHVQGAFFMVRRKVFDELQGFDPRFFMYCEDLDFTLRANQAGWNSYYLASTQSYHRGRGSTYRIGARRLFYYLYSLTQYVGKNFGIPAGILIMSASIGLEFWTRLVWSLMKRSDTTFLQTLTAYGMFVRALPRLIRDLKQT